MNPLRISLLALCAAGIGAAANHSWSVGKVLDANARRDIVQTGTTFQSNTYGTASSGTSGTVTNFGNSAAVNASTDTTMRSTTTGTTQAQHTIFQDNQILIQGAEYLYTINDLTQKDTRLFQQGALARAIANRKHGCRMVVGDPIQYEQVKDKLFVQDEDGKVCKLDIVRQERIASAQTAGVAR